MRAHSYAISAHWQQTCADDVQLTTRRPQLLATYPVQRGMRRRHKMCNTQWTCSQYRQTWQVPHLVAERRCASWRRSKPEQYQVFEDIGPGCHDIRRERTDRLGDDGMDELSLNWQLITTTMAFFLAGLLGKRLGDLLLHRGIDKADNQSSPMPPSPQVRKTRAARVLGTAIPGLPPDVGAYTRRVKDTSRPLLGGKTMIHTMHEATVISSAFRTS